MLSSMLARVVRVMRPSVAAARTIDGMVEWLNANVADLKIPAAAGLLDRIEYAKSMRELWHLRAEVFALVSLELSQIEADRRLAMLNRHFPTRAPRSGFVGLRSDKEMWP